MRPFFLILFISTLSLSAQSQKKELDHSVYDAWNRIEEEAISNDGQWVKYRIQPGKGDPTLKLVNQKGEEVLSVDRGTHAKFSWDSRFLVFHIKPHLDSVNNMKRRKVKKKDLPQDSLGILNLSNMQLTRIPQVQGYTLPEEWSGWVVIDVKDSTDEKARNLLVRELETAHQDTVISTMAYTLSKKAPGMIYELKGDSLTMKGIYRYDFDTKSNAPLYRAKGKYVNLTLDDQGNQYSFMVDRDTAKHLVSTFQLALGTGSDSANIIMNLEHQILKDRILSEHKEVMFSKDGSLLYFGIAPVPVLQDTSLLEDEITTVEVWSYTDARLHTQQNIEEKDDKKKAYLTSYNVMGKSFNLLENNEVPDIALSDEESAGYYLGVSNLPYQKYISWEGYPRRFDFYRVSEEGKKEKIAENVVSASYGISPFGKYAYWYNSADTTWNIYSFEKESLVTYGTNIVNFSDELNDKPNHPSPNGMAGWTKDDKNFLVYDRYDIFQLDPSTQDYKKCTSGRESMMVYRVMNIDPLEKYINSSQSLLVKTRSEISEKQGLASLDLKKGKTTQLVEEDMQYNSVIKAHESNEIIFTKENFRTYPDLILSDLKLSKPKLISNVNPQQDEYLWGNTEIYEWTSLDGQKIRGVLVKPDNFDPNKKYPLLVNFYERSVHNIHRHRPPTPGRSTISYSFYTSRGYVIFNPDIPYRIGYPGESCYNAVIPGVTSLIDEGFIDKDRIGVQGHSWGGYQIAYLVTKTDMFKCAEAGAPVPNMISAYGGIRWWTGLSRMFQYEHTQSRIGGTLWEYPIRYIENSPIFFVDKINTPVLIMHNDADGHVPWYQGIEFFVSLRRLGKPSWMLNYRGEPHWPLEWKNRVDFNIRLQQYFDHYLKDAPIPKWMAEGVPSVEKGINLGYELVGEE